MGFLDGNMPAITADVIKTMKETLHEGFFKNPDILALFNVQEGIKSDKQLPVFKRYSGLAGWANSADCDITENSDVTVGMINKTWSPKYIGDRFAECFDTFDSSFTAWMLKEGVDKADITGTELGAFIVMNIEDLLKEVIMRHAFFGDTAIVAGTGNSIATGKAKYFNVIDGVFAQLFDIVAADSTRLTVDTTIQTRNAAASYALQKFTSTDTTNSIVTNALDTAWYESDQRMRDMDTSELVWLVTGSIADQYEKERKRNNTLAESWLRMENGVKQMFSNGIEVLPMRFWDRTIRAYFGDDQTPVKDVLPHRAILVPRKNIYIGCESASSLDKIDPFYSKEKKKMFTDFAVKFDVKIGLDNMVQAIY